MKNIFTLWLLGLSLVTSAQNLQESHGNREDERKCFRQIRNVGCGNPENHDAFVACVDGRVQRLSPDCRSFHTEEVQRLKQHRH